MKTLTKGILLGGLFLILSGSLLALAGWAMGADVHALDAQVERRISQIERAGWWLDRQEDPIRKGGGQEENLALEPFHTLQIEADLANVTICQGKDYGISLSWWGTGYSLAYENQDGVLSVRSLPARTELEQRGGEIQIYLPAGAVLEGGTMDVGMGDLHWEEVPASGRLALSMGMGDIEITGEIKGAWTVETGMGDISVEAGAVEGYFEAETGMGEVHMTAATTPQSCQYQLDTGMGGAYINGEKQKEGTAKGGAGQGSIHLTSGMGEVELEFWG